MTTPDPDPQHDDRRRSDLRRTFKTRTATGRGRRAASTSTSSAGEIFGFLGPNGAGKTTTLRMLATLITPTAGEATVAGADLRRAAAAGPPADRLRPAGRLDRPGRDRPRRARPPGPALRHERAPTRRPARPRSSPRSTSRPPPTAPTGTYSGGMRRRLDVGLGIVHRPQVLFLDEPTTGLDPQARARMWDEIRKLRELGTTVFLTTHYLEEADALCDRLAIIDHGRIVAEGTSDQLKQKVAGDVVTIGVNGAGASRPRRSSRRCRSSARRRTTTRPALVRLYVDRGETAVPQLLRSLDAAGFAPTSISLNKPSLDDVFLRQTGRSLREEAA